MIELDQHHRAVDAVIERAMIVMSADPRKMRVAQMIERLFELDGRMARAHAMKINAEEIAQHSLLLGGEVLKADAFVGHADVVVVRRREHLARQALADNGLGLLLAA